MDAVAVGYGDDDDILGEVAVRERISFVVVFVLVVFGVGLKSAMLLMCVSNNHWILSSGT